VLRERSGYRLRATSAMGLADEAYYRTRKGDLEAARTQLEWVDSGLRRMAGLFGVRQPLQHLWQGRTTPGWRMRLAAASGVVSDEWVDDAIREIQGALKGHRKLDRETRLQLNIALAQQLGNGKRWNEMLAQARRLEGLGASPERALWLTYSALNGLKRRRRAVALIKRWIKTHPHDSHARVVLAREAANALRVSEVEQQLEQAGVGAGIRSSVYNDLAWNLMAVRPGDPRALTYAEKAAQLSEHQNPSVLDTLAVVYAEAGRLGNARLMWHRGMQLAGHPLPEKHDWYAFGRIAEAVGLLDLAAASYARVSPPEVPFPHSTHELAQRRLERLKR
jgi:hypothetical protein